jgi:osmotically-inducible protein OsmY
MIDIGKHFSWITHGAAMRTDANIRVDVKNELRWDQSLDEKSILVKVDDGVVSLEGSVPHFCDRWTAEQVTKRVAGVRAIANDIEVRIPKPGERQDSDIARAAANALQWHFALESSDIQPVVKHGWITLSGHVSYGYQKTIAESVVRHLLGVKGVFDNIEVRHAVQAKGAREKEDAEIAASAAPEVTKVENKLQVQF